MSPIEDLNKIIYNYTIAYRKGAEVTVKEVGNMRVVEVVGYPEAPSHGDLVDVHFLMIGFTEAAADQDAFEAALQAAYGQGEFTEMTESGMSQGPSYITLGAWLGSQDQALRFIALLAHYGGQVITPEALGITGEQADALAGGGMVMGLPRKPTEVDA